MLYRRSIAQGCIAGRGKAAHGRGGGVGGRLFEGSARKVVRHGHHLRARVARGGAGGIVAPGDHGRGRHGDARVRQGHGGAADFLLLGRVQDLAGAHGGRVHRGGRVRGSVSSRPGIGELGRIVVGEVMLLVNTVKTHPAVLAVLVFNDHRHGG